MTSKVDCEGKLINTNILDGGLIISGIMKVVKSNMLTNAVKDMMRISWELSRARMGFYAYRD